MPANHPQDEQRRPPGEQAEPGGAASAQHVDGAPQGPGRTARQQRRYGRGQQAAQRRKEAKKSTPLEKNSGCTQEVAAAEQAAGAYAAAIQSSFDATSASAADDSRSPSVSTDEASAGTQPCKQHSFSTEAEAGHWRAVAVAQGLQPGSALLLVQAPIGADGGRRKGQASQGSHQLRGDAPGKAVPSPPTGREQQQGWVALLGFVGGSRDGFLGGGTTVRCEVHPRRLNSQPESAVPDLLRGCEVRPSHCKAQPLTALHTAAQSHASIALALLP